MNGNGDAGLGIESRFENGCYKGYEVQLELKRSLGCAPVQLNSAGEIHSFMRALSNESSEYVYQLLMDTRHRLTGVYMAGKGGINECLVDPKELYKAALVTNSPCFAIVHNHPSGIPEPSPDDKSLAARIASGARILDLDFLDFIVIGDGSYVSFKTSGLLL